MRAVKTENDDLVCYIVEHKICESIDDVFIPQIELLSGGKRFFRE